MVRLGLSLEAFIERTEIEAYADFVIRRHWSTVLVMCATAGLGMCRCRADRKLAGAALDVHAVVTCGW